MSEYTVFLEDRIYEISPEDENYREELIAVAGMFRNFDEALDEFLQERCAGAADKADPETAAAQQTDGGAADKADQETAAAQQTDGAAADQADPETAAAQQTDGAAADLTDADAKAAYIRARCAAAGVPAPRGIRSWFTEHKGIERPTAIRLCFAFGLSAEESDRFLRRVCLQRGLDCHNPEELLSYFALRHGLPYTDVAEAAAALPATTFGRMEMDSAAEILYTASILREVDRFTHLSELTGYITENIDQFRYNNATAYRLIRTLWERISADGGLAKQEWASAGLGLDEAAFLGSGDLYESEPAGSGAGDGAREENTGSPAEGRRAAAKSRLRPGASVPLAGLREDRSLSAFETLLHIFGLRRDEVRGPGSDRSLKHILRDNALLHPQAEDSFPDRDGLEKILNGAHVSNERVRKLLILLVFYRYWAELAIARGDYGSRSDDGERCAATMDSYLTDAGHDTLYAGNPYDWIFLYAMTSEYPLPVLRDFMGEMAAVKALARSAQP